MSEKQDELLILIKEEKKKINDLDFDKVFKYYYKCHVKTIIDIYNKFKTFKDFDYFEALLLGTNLFHNVFWILISYSKNLKLTIFLSERAILLYTEFIIMSRDPKINNELYFVPSLIDALSFSYKKTIGPLKLNDISNNPESHQDIYTYKNLSSIVKLINQKGFNYIKSDVEINNLEEINNIFTASIIKNHDHFKKEKFYSDFFDCCLSIFNDIEISYMTGLYFVRILLELLVDIRKKNTKYDIFFSDFMRFYEKYKKNLNNITIKKIKNIRKCKTYIIIKNKILKN